MRDDEDVWRGRLRRYVEELVVPALYPRSVALDVAAWQVPGEPVPFAEAVAQRYQPFPVGSLWGPAWSTMWLHVTGEVPPDWRDLNAPLEVLVDLGFRAGMYGGQAEGLAYLPSGTIIKGVEPFHRHIPVASLDGGPIELYIEAAANPDLPVGGSWTPTAYGSRATAPEEPMYRLRRLDLAVRDTTVWEVLQDIEVLEGLVHELPADSPRRARIVAGLHRAMDVTDPDDVAGTAAAARKALRPVLDSPAHASAHHIVATGHAHIDSAWLWPVRETVRKCARTFANVLALMDEDEDLVFSCSSAQQYAWVKEHYPQLWERIKTRVAEGRFAPVGGMWVESDTNIPGSEALVRQFVMGKRFFSEELGHECLEVWLPDSFGYSASLPQIARLAGARWLLTQKLSWNETNRMPHHTFWWEGIDGSRIFTHFPPVDTYNCRMTALELARAERQYAEHGHGSVSLVPFGYGDGGGGPNQEMLAKARRTADLEGSPRVRLGTAEDFFREAEAELPEPSVWVGEMYLETHRGTYTSQLRTKQGNRRCEHALRAAELWATTAAVQAGLPYPAAELEQAWRTVLLHAFHDILPGSSIAWVHREAETSYERVLTVLDGIVDRSLRALVGDGDIRLVVNSAPVVLGNAAPLSVSTAPRSPDDVRVAVTPDGGDLVVGTGPLRARVDARGLLTSLVDVASGREVVPPGEAAGLLQLHDDRPSKFEAWDIDPHIRRVATDLTDADSVTVTRQDGACVEITVTRSFASSTVVTTYSFTAGSPAVDLDLAVDWHENRKLLKLAFPLDVLTERAASEVQFGHVYRSTHANTSWDMARYETCAHRWVHVGEPGFGVAVGNDSTYGHDIHRERYPASGCVGTTVRLSLIRGPRFPDPEADQGLHRLRFSLVVGADIGEAVRVGQRLNQPPREVSGAHPVPALVTVDSPSVLVEAVKLAEDGSGDVVVRLYESLGSRAHGEVVPRFAHDGVVSTDLLERRLPDVEQAAEGTAAPRIAFRPFEIVTLRFARPRGFERLTGQMPAARTPARSR